MDAQALSPNVAKVGVIEVLGRDGRVQGVHRIERWPARIGRSPACEVTLADAHLAAEHAELHWDDDTPELALLPSLNGGWLGDRRLQAGERLGLAPNVHLQLGATQLRWRSTQAPQAPEQPIGIDPLRVAHTRLPLVLLLFCAWLGLEVFGRWLAVEPGTKLVEYSAPLLSALAMALAWAGLWSLLSQLFQHRFPFSTHLKRVLLVLIGVELVGYALPAVGYALSWPRVLALDSFVTALAIAGLIWWHGMLVWPRARKTLAVTLAALCALSLGLQAARNVDHQHWFGPNYLAALPMPALRLARPVTPDAFVDSVKPLEDQLKRAAHRDGDDGSGGDDED